jgi:hypothetical protein
MSEVQQLAAGDMALARKVAQCLRSVARYRQSPEPLLAGPAVILYSCQVQAEYLAAGCEGESLSDFLGPATEATLMKWAQDTRRGLAMFASESLPLLRQRKYKTAELAARGVERAGALLAPRLAAELKVIA